MDIFDPVLSIEDLAFQVFLLVEGFDDEAVQFLGHVLPLLHLVLESCGRFGDLLLK
jgi:hypothetical protein